eukprot:g1807.t1
MKRTEKKNLHLITDEGFLRSYGLALLVFAGTAAALYAFEDTRSIAEDAFDAYKVRALRVAHDYQMWTVVGLLSSSCCVIQVVLSAFQVGCAGFNTWLGPLRPYSLAMGTLAQSLSWYVAIRFRRSDHLASAAGVTLLTIALSMSPEVVFLLYKRNANMKRSARLVVESSSSSSIDSATPPRTRASFRLEKIGCISCLRTVQSVASKSPGVLEMEEIEASERRYDLRLSCTTLSDAQKAADEFRGRVRDAGFDATLLSVGFD